MSGRDSSFVVCGALMMLLLLCTLFTSAVVLVIIAPVLVTLLGAELDRSGGRIAVHLVRMASYVLPRRVRREHADEWVDHVLREGEVGFRPVFTGLSIVVGAARIALRLRVRSATAELLITYFAAVLSTAAPRLDETGESATLRGPMRFTPFRWATWAVVVPLLPIQMGLIASRRRPLRPSWLFLLGVLGWLVVCLLHNASINRIWAYGLFAVVMPSSIVSMFSISAFTWAFKVVGRERGLAVLGRAIDLSAWPSFV